MKIIQVISSLGNGGAEKLVVELSNELSKSNDVTIVCFRNIEEWMYNPKNICPSVSIIQLGKKEGFDYTIFFKLAILFKKIKPDIVNAHLDSTVRYIYLISLFYKKCKYYYTLHSKLNSQKINLFNLFEKLPLFRKKFHNICISKSIFQDFKKKYPHLKFYHINNGINKISTTNCLNDVKEEIKSFNKNNWKIFVAIGRIHHVKNFTMLVNIFSRLKEENILLFIIGAKCLGEETEFSLLQKMVGINSFYLGPKSNIADYIFNSDALILSSLQEGMPIVILEALSLGKPVITTPVGGAVDLIRNGENGFISKSIDEDDLMNSILDFINADEQTINHIKINNTKLFEAELSIKTCAENYVKLYKENCNNK